MNVLAPLGPGRVRERQPLLWRLQRWISNWLPLALMAVLALATTWLVKQTPMPDGAGGRVVDSAKPDYEMRRFELQRFGADGATRALLTGEVMRHYPSGDRLEMEGLRLRAQAQDGSWLMADAARASGPMDGSLLQLSGGVTVRRYAPGVEPDGVAPPLMQLRTAEMRVEAQGQRLSSRSATEVITPRSQMQMAGFRYDHGKNLLQFNGPSQISVPPRALPSRP